LIIFLGSLLSLLEERDNKEEMLKRFNLWEWRRKRISILF